MINNKLIYYKQVLDSCTLYYTDLTVGNNKEFERTNLILNKVQFACIYNNIKQKKSRQLQNMTKNLYDTVFVL